MLINDAFIVLWLWLILYVWCQQAIWCIMQLFFKSISYSVCLISVRESDIQVSHFKCDIRTSHVTDVRHIIGVFLVWLMGVGVTFDMWRTDVTFWHFGVTDVRHICQNVTDVHHNFSRDTRMSLSFTAYYAMNG